MELWVQLWGSPRLLHARAVSMRTVPAGVRVCPAGQWQRWAGSAGSACGQHSSSAMSRMLLSSMVKVGRSSGFSCQQLYMMA